MKYNFSNTVFLIFVFIITILSVQAQNDYYYNNGKKFHLTKDLTRISVNVTDTTIINNFSNYFKSRTAFAENNNRKLTTAFDSIAQAKKDEENYYTEIQVTDSIASNLIDYTNFLNQLNNESNIIRASQTFLTQEGHELGMSNYFYVKINHSQLAQLTADASNHYVEIIGHDKFMNDWYVLSINKENPEDAIHLANQFYSTGNYVDCEPELMYHNLSGSNDPMFTQQWNIENTGQYGSSHTGTDVNIGSTWNISKGVGMKVAIYDEGIQVGHPDLRANIFGSGFDVITGTSPSVLRGDHGTHCAGIVGAIQDNGIGITGVAPECDLVSIRTSLDWRENSITIS
jgi:subtilisin family serine protease